MSDKKLKVTVSEFFPLEENTADNDNIQKQIKERLDQRASLILASHISLNLAQNKISHEADLMLNNLIIDILATGQMTAFECNENNYCSANGEYDIEEFQKNLDSINNR